MSDKILSPGEYALLRESELRNAIQRAPGFRAFERGATVLSLGALCWGGFYLYSVFSGWASRIEETLGDITGEGSVVEGGGLSEEEIQAAVAGFTPKNISGPAGMVYGSKANYERYLRVVSAKAEAGEPLVGAERGDLEKIKGSGAGGGKLHPLDRVARFVLHDKNYWGLVLGITVLPVVPVAIAIMRDVRRETG